MIKSKYLTIKEAQEWLAHRGFIRSHVWLKTMVYKGNIESLKDHNMRWISTKELRRVMREKPTLKVVINVLAFFLLFQTAAMASGLHPDAIVIHHTATQNGREYSIEQCNNDHNARGWSGCGYNFIIQPNGRIDTARGFERIGAHTKGHNAHTVGVAIAGKGEITAKQLAALSRIRGKAEAIFGKLPLYPHKHFRATQCPSDRVWQTIRGAYVTAAA